MKKLIAVLALCLAIGGASAAWEKISESDDATFYLDPATIRRVGNLRIVWELIDLKKRDPDGELSVRYKSEYDCKLEKHRFVYMSSHSGPMVTGQTIRARSVNENWVDIPPRTPNEWTLKIVCLK